VRARGFGPWPVVQPSCQVFSRSAQATNRVAAAVCLGALSGAAVVLGFLLQGATVESVWKRSFPTAAR